MMEYAWRYITSLGIITLRGTDTALTALSLGYGSVPPETALQETRLIRNAAMQLEDYLCGERMHFDLPLDPRGTPFQLQVWQALRNIPYGETRSYADIARMIGSPKAYRAVGRANHCNPIPIIIPCHRVIGTDGSLVGYAGGLALKRKLLGLEFRCRHRQDR